MKCNLRSQYLKPPSSVETHHDASLQNNKNWFSRFIPNTKYKILNTNVFSKSFSRYIIISIFLIIITGLGFGLYSQFIKNSKKDLAYTTAASPASPGRQLSFQGRLTDSAGNPISSSSTIIFRLYNSPSSDIGTSLYTSDTGNSQVVIPTIEDNGIFSVIIGKTHGAAIPSSVFTENTEVFLEITVNGETMEPRQQIATVAYALNSETLQGLPPSSTGLRDTVMVLDANGHINLGETTPAIIATNDSLRLEGQGLLLSASDGSGGDITINPDAGGILDLSFEMNAPAIGGFIKASADANMISGNLYYGKVLSDYSNNYNFLNFQNYDLGSTNLTTRFSVGASGNIYAAGNVGIGITSAIYKLNVGGTLNASSIFQNGTPLDIGATLTYTAGSGLTLSSSQFKLGGALTENMRLNIGNTESIYIQYTTGNVGIGTTNISSKLYVKGVNSSLPALIIDIASPLTANLAEFKIGGSTKSIIDENGYYGFNTANPQAPIHSYVTSATSGVNQTAGIFSASRGVGQTSIYLRPLDVFSNWASTDTGSEVRSLTFESRVSADSTVTTLKGIHSWVGINAGIGATITTANTIYAAGVAANDAIVTFGHNLELGGASVNNGYISSKKGVIVYDSSVSGTGSIANQYGVYINSLTAATNDYSIYTNLGDISLGDNLIIRNDNDKIQIGAGNDLELYHDGTNSNITNSTNDLYFSSTSDIIIQPSSGNVGIGTTAPKYKLEVAGSGLFTSLGVGVTHPSYSLYTSGKFGVGSTAYFASFVGIGTTNPLVKLDIDGNTASNIQTIFTRGVNDSNFQLISSIGNSGNTPGTLEAFFGLRYAGINNATTGINFYRGDNELDSYLTFKTNATEQMIISNTGNVGIGTTNPLYKLDVGGTLNATTIFQNGSPLDIGATNTYTAGSGLTLSSSQFKLGGAITENMRLNIGNTESLYIQYSTGNIGIGKTNPSAALDINGNTIISGVLSVPSITDITTISPPATIKTKINTSLATMTASSTFSSQVPALSVDGNTATYWHSSAGVNGQWLKIDFGADAGKIVTKIRLYHADTTELTGNIQGSNNDSEWSTIASFDHNGINSWFTEDFSNSTTYRYYRLYFNGIGGNWIQIKEWELWENSTGLITIDSSLNVSGRIAAGDSSYQQAVIPNGGIIAQGSLGIGTTAPLYKLHIIGDALISTRLGIGSTNSLFALNVGGTLNATTIFQNGAPLDIGATNTYTAGSGLTLDTGTFKLGGAITENMRLNIGNTESVYIYYPSGNIGLGTTNPETKLEINSGDMTLSKSYGGSSSGISFGKIIGKNTWRTTNNIVGYIDFLKDSSSDANFAAITFNTGTYGGGTAEQMRISSGNGNVGIGTTNPTSKLNVIGNGYFSTNLNIGSSLTIGSIPTLSDNNIVLSSNSGIISSINTSTWDKSITDDYTGWILQGSSSNSSNVSTGSTINFTGTGAASVSKSGNTITINSAVGTTLTYFAGSGLNLDVGKSFNLGGALNQNMRLNIGNTESLYIQYTTGNIGIGTTNPSAKLEINSINNDHLRFTNGSNSVNIGLDSSGILKIGNTTSPVGFVLFDDPGQANRSILASRRYINSSENVYGYNIDLHKTGSSGAAGILAFVYADTGSTGTVAMDSAYLYNNISGPYSIPNQNGLRSIISNDVGSTITNELTGIQSRFHGALGNIQNSSYFFRARNTVTSMSTPKLYGLYIDPLTQGNDNFAIFTEGNTKSYFGGNVGIGTTNPLALLHLNSTSNNLTSSNILQVGHTATYADSYTISGKVLDLSRIINYNNVGTTGTTIVFDTGSSGIGNTGSATTTWQHTVNTSDNSILIVSPTWAGFAPTTTLSSVTFNGVGLTKFDGINSQYGVVKTEIWYLKNPPVGTYNITVTLSNARYMVAGASSWSGVNQDVPFGTFVGTNNSAMCSSSPVSIGVTSATDEVVIDAAGMGGSGSSPTLTVDGNQTQIWNTKSGDISQGGSRKAGTDSTTMSWVFTLAAQYCAMGAAPLKPATGTIPALTINGNLASISSNCVETGGGCTDSATLLNLNQQFTKSLGSVLNISNSGIGNLITLDAGNTAANGINLDIQSSSPSQYALKITSGNNSHTNLYVRADGNVGIGTTNPLQKLSIIGDASISTHLTVGGTFVSVGSTNTVTNLSADYLDGFNSNYFLNIGQTGSLPYVNNATNSTLTRAGSGPYTLGLNLGSTNTWTAPTTFNNNLTIGGTFVSVGSTSKVANLNAELVDGIHASSTRTANQLLSLDSSSRFNAPLYILDTRNTTPAVADFSQSLNMDFKTNTAIGLSYGSPGTYSAVASVAPWHDDSGGGNHQIAFSQSGSGIYYRNGTRASGWNTWSPIWTGTNDGIGSSLDADLLDGFHSSSFLQVGYTGFESYLTFNNGLTRTVNTIGLGGTLSQHTNINLASSNLFFLGTGNTQSLFLEASGNVGIGTTNPGVKLDVAGDLKINSQDNINKRHIITITRDIGATATNYVNIGTVTTNGKGTYINIYESHHFCGTLNSANYEIQDTFYSGDTTDWMQVPTHNFRSYSGGQDFAIDIKKISHDVPVELRIRNINGTCGTGQIHLEIQTNGTFTPSTTSGTGATVVGLLSNNLYQFPVSNNLFKASSDGLFILPSGNVGIGTTNPNYKLDVGGTLNATTIFQNGSPLAVGTTYTAGSGLTLDSTQFKLGGALTENMRLNIGSSEVLFIKNSNSFIGIGTTNPIAPLTISHPSDDDTNYTLINVNNGTFLNQEVLKVEANAHLGTSYARLVVGQYGALTIQSGGVTPSTAYLHTSAVGDMYFGAAANKDVHFSVHQGRHTIFGDGMGNETIRFMNTGNVGIGTSAPNYKLEVAGAGLFNSLGVGVTNPNYSLYTSGKFGVGSTAYFASSVGIGTTDNTTYRVHIQDSLKPLRVSNGVHGFNFYIENNAAWTTTNDAPFHFRTRESSDVEMTLDNDGDLGVGTSTPDAKIEAYGYSGDEIMKAVTFQGGASFFDIPLSVKAKTSAGATNSIGPGIAFLAEHNDGVETTIGKIGAMRDTAANEGALVFRAGTNGNQEFMRITHDGRVGIGTTGPVVKLHIAAGDVRIDNGYQIYSPNTFIMSAADAYHRITLDQTSSKLTLKEWGAIHFDTNSDSTDMILDTNGNVGIGTSNPLYKLHVSGDALISTRLGIGSTNSLYALNVGGTLNATTIFQNGSPLGVGTTYTAGSGLTLSSSQFKLGGAITENMRLNIGNTESLYIQYTTGNVGIGTTTPAGLLHVNGAVPDIFFGDTTLTTGNNLRGLRFTPYPDGNIYIDTKTYTNGKTYFRAGAGAESGAARTWMTLDNTTGNVGIGITGPGAKLDVKGWIRAEGGNAANRGDSGAIEFYNYYTDSQNVQAQIKALRGFNDYKAGQLGFFTASASTGTLNEWMTITEGGNVGIGTTGPGYKLHVIGNTRIEGIMYADSQFISLLGDSESAPAYSFGSDANTGMFTPAVDTLAFTTNGTERLRIQSSDGNVGIGTTNPVSRLSIADANNNLLLFSRNPSTVFSDLSATSAILNLEAPTNTDASGIWYRSGTRDWFAGITKGTSERFDIKNESDTWFSINTSGNVGIGTTGPTAKLEVNALNTEQNIGLVVDAYDSTNPSLGVREASLSLNGQFSTGVGFASAQIINTPTANADSTFRFLTRNNTGGESSATEKLRISANGSIGIGTSSPISRTGFGGPWLTIRSTAPGIAFVDNDTANNTKYLSTNAGYLDIGKMNDDGTSPTSQLYIGSDGKIGVGTATPGTAGIAIMSGNVGIGTTNPGYKLTVISGGTSSYPLGIYTSTGSNLFNIYEDASSNGRLDLRTNGGGIAAQINTNGNSYFNGGNVGIGTTNPSEKLHVKSGNIVIDNGYSLKSYDTGGTSRMFYILDSGNEQKFGASAALPSGGNTRLRASGVEFGLYIQASTGKVGIGTSAPATIFDVYGGKFNVTTGGNVGIGTTNPLYKLHVNGDVLIATRLGVGSTDSNYSLYTSEKFGVGSTAYFASNVGIGTTNPVGLLDIKGAIYGSSIYNYLDLYTGGNAQLLSRGNIVLRFDSDNSQTDRVFQIQNNTGTELLTINESGSIGIGTTNPISTLDINSANAAQIITLRKTGATYWHLGIQNDTGDGFQIGDGASITPRLTIKKTTGYVGIGTTNPAANLEVNGNVKVNGYIFGDSTDSLRLAAGGTTPGSGQNGSIYFLKSDGTTVAGRLDTTYAGDGTEVLDQSFTSSTSHYTNIGYTGAAADWGGQVFTTGATAGNLSKVTFKMCDGTVSGDYSVWVDVYEVDSYTNLPTGGVMSSSNTVATGNIGVGHTTINCTDDIEEDFTFASPPFLKANTRYTAMIKMSGGGGNNWVRVRKYQSVTDNGYLSGFHQSTTDGGTNWVNVNPNGGVYEDLYFKTYRTTRYGSLYIGGINTGEADVAENYPSTQNLEAGDVVSFDKNNSSHIIKSTKSYDKNIMGIISTKPGLLLGNSDGDSSKQYPVALSGRVPVKISLENGPIQIGDPLTASPTKPGFAMKATKAGTIVAKALENSTTGDTIMAFVNVSYYDPNLELTSTGQININYNVSSSILSSLGYNDTKNEIESAKYYLNDSIDNLVDRIGQFKEIASAKIKTGLLTATNIISDRIISKTSISENLISPKANIEKLTATTATISGTLIANDSVFRRSTIDDLQSNTATISTLYADQIISKEGSITDVMAEKISSLRDEMKNWLDSNSSTESTPSALIADSTNWTSDVRAGLDLPLSETDNIQLTNNLIIGAKLTVQGDTQMGNAFITGTFTTGEIAIKDNFIETTNTALYLQPSGLGAVHILGDTLIIADTGEVTINGNLAINGKISASEASVSGSLIANMLEANEIKTKKITSEELLSDKINITTGAALPAQTAQLLAGQTIIADSGFAQLATSSAELQTNATAGTATLPAGKTDLIIHTQKLTSNSMVYLTPNGSTNNQVVYVKSKFISEDSALQNFIIALDQPLTTAVDINWWIIN